MSIRQTPFFDDSAWERLQGMVRRLAREEIMERFHHAGASVKTDGSLVTEADRAMQVAMEAALYREWPQYAFLGEESATALQKGALSRPGGCWVLDPLDGTTNFFHGFEMFCCSLALLIGGEPVLGIVYDPVRDELFSARRGLGAALGENPLSLHTLASGLGECLALVDFKRLPRRLAALLATDPPFASQRNLGSVALDWCWMAAGRADLYLHGGQKLWDYAAGHLIFSEAGGASCTFEGEPVPLPAVDTRSAVAASGTRLLELWKEYLRKISRESD